MRNDDPVRQFFRRHRATAVGGSPSFPPRAGDPEERPDVIDLSCEVEPDDWQPRTPSEQPAYPGEYPTRFIDGCHTGHAVTCLRNPTHGWPVAVFLAEVGGVAMKLDGRQLVREFFGLEQVVSFVVDAFPWDEIEGLAAAISNLGEFPLRLLPARRPQGGDVNLFDYEVHRQQAETRTKQEMATWEAVAIDADQAAVTLLDGRLASRLLTAPTAGRGLLVAVVKTHAQNYLHDEGWRTLLDLRPGQRTPFFQIDRRQTGNESALPVATWYLKLAGGDFPNWGVVRVEVPWVQFIDRWPTREQQTGFVNRLSRWLIDARCRQESYARMPVSLEPIVRAEESLKSLFTPFGVLRNRFLRHAGVFAGSP
ncbi:MAG TPA: hypothetical protein VKE74_20580 [Gemmataceae bacterium]|nr:hypothetical protein [Gemmataceae bacterium]